MKEEYNGKVRMASSCEGYAKECCQGIHAWQWLWKWCHSSNSEECTWKLLCMTAYHVIQKAEETGATIEIELAESQEKILLPSLARTIFTAKDRDQALVLFNAAIGLGDVSRFKLLSVNRHYVPGVEFGWLGYPVLEIAKNTPCFLHGRVSAYLDDVEAYLVDGFSIHGVSGGPVFCCEENGDLVLAGIVTNYFPNQITIPNSGTQSWPGLAMFRTVNPLMKLYAQENKVKPQQLPSITATSYK